MVSAASWKAPGELVDAIPCSVQCRMGSGALGCWPWLAGLAVAALTVLQLLWCRGAVHIQLLGALTLVTPLAPLTSPQIRFAPDFPCQNSQLFRDANFLGICRGNQSDSWRVSSNFRTCQAPANTTPDPDGSVFPRQRGLESPRATIFPAMPLGKQINSEHGYRIWAGIWQSQESMNQVLYPSIACYWKRKHMGIVDSGITGTENAHQIVLQSPLWRLQAAFFLLFLFKIDSVSHLNILNPLNYFTQFSVLCPAEGQLLPLY